MTLFLDCVIGKRIPFSLSAYSCEPAYRGVSADLPGYELFQYVDETGARHTIDSAEVNSYLRKIAADDFTAKDFRTWVGQRSRQHHASRVRRFHFGNRGKEEHRRSDQGCSPSVGQHPRPSAASVMYIPLFLSIICAAKRKQTLTNSLKYASRMADIPMGLRKEEQDLLCLVRNRVTTHP
jgi:DNA topoisomerase IB